MFVVGEKQPSCEILFSLAFDLSFKSEFEIRDTFACCLQASFPSVVPPRAASALGNKFKTHQCARIKGIINCKTILLSEP